MAIAALVLRMALDRVPEVLAMGCGLFFTAVNNSEKGTDFVCDMPSVSRRVGFTLGRVCYEYRVMIGVPSKCGDISGRPSIKMSTVPEAMSQIAFERPRITGVRSSAAARTVAERKRRDDLPKYNSAEYVQPGASLRFDQVLKR